MEVTVKTAELELRTCKLTKSILKQIPSLEYRDAIAAMKTGAVVGWVHGSVIGEDHQTIVLLKTGEGTYGQYYSHSESRKKYPQIYIV